MSDISRRGFLGCLAAFAGAMASGVKLPAATAAPTPESASMLDTLVEMLKHCKAVAVSKEGIGGGRFALNVDYIYDPDGTHRGADLNDLVRDITRGKSIAEASVTTQADYVDVFHLGEIVNEPLTRAAHTVSVRWV